MDAAGYSRSERYHALVVSALVLVLVLVSAYVALLLYKKKPSEGFVSRFDYKPSCGWSRFDCRRDNEGLTHGAMPAINSEMAVSGKMCCGCSGVPAWPM